APAVVGTGVGVCDGRNRVCEHDGSDDVAAGDVIVPTVDRVRVLDERQLAIHRKRVPPASGDLAGGLAAVGVVDGDVLRAIGFVGVNRGVREIAGFDVADEAVVDTREADECRRAVLVHFVARGERLAPDVFDADVLDLVGQAVGANCAAAPLVVDGGG